MRYSLFFAASFTLVGLGACAVTNEAQTSAEVLPPGGGGEGGSDGSGGQVGAIDNENSNGETDELEECARDRFQGVVRAASVLVVLDVSDSMSRDDKWSQTQAALNATLGDAPNDLEVGITFFPAALPITATCEDVSLTPAVPIKMLTQSRGAISSSMSQEEPRGGTPTLPALQAGYDILQTHETVGERYLLLITDGDPTLLEYLDPPAPPGPYHVECGSVADIEDAVAGALVATQPVKTLVVASPGVTKHGDMSTLGNLGGMQRAPDCSVEAECDAAGDCCHYQPSGANFGEALSTVLEEIRGRVHGCTFDLPAGEDVDTNKVNVDLEDADGANRILRDPSQSGGWDYTDETQSAITLHGADCERVKTDAATDVVIVVGCPTEVLK